MNRPLYTVSLTRAAEKDLKGYRGYQDLVIEELLTLEQNPERGHTLQGSLKGVRSLEFSLNGVAHRAVYVILNDEASCLVFLIGPHENIYKRAERRYRALLRMRAEH